MMQAVYQFWGLYRPEAKSSPLNDVRVREALSLAIDRQQIIDHVMAEEARWPMPFAAFKYSSDMTIPRGDDWSRTKQLSARIWRKPAATVADSVTAVSSSVLYGKCPATLERCRGAGLQISE